jgi:ParB family chromosome partitioning protein
MTDGKQKLDYLFGLSPEMPRIIEIELTKLRPNPDQPRKRFNEETIKELAMSIEQHGLIQPISVVPDPESQDGFVIVAGERRYRSTSRNPPSQRLSPKATPIKSRSLKTSSART